MFDVSPATFTRPEAPVRYVLLTASTHPMTPTTPGVSTATDATDTSLDVELVVQDGAGNRRRIWPPEGQA